MKLVPETRGTLFRSRMRRCRSKRTRRDLLTKALDMALAALVCVSDDRRLWVLLLSGASGYGLAERRHVYESCSVAGTRMHVASRVACAKKI